MYFAFCLSHYFDFTIYLYYPVLKRPCYHFAVEVDNKNNFTVIIWKLYADIIAYIFFLVVKAVFKFTHSFQKIVREFLLQQLFFHVIINPNTHILFVCSNF